MWDVKVTKIVEARASAYIVPWIGSTQWQTILGRLEY
jgi:hypothetical protein